MLTCGGIVGGTVINDLSDTVKDFSQKYKSFIREDQADRDIDVIFTSKNRR